MHHDDLQQFIIGLDERSRTIVSALRMVVHRIVPDAEETIVWGCISYHLPKIGGRVKGAVCQIVPKRGEVRLDFIHGIRLADPKRLLRGDGVSKRFVPIPTVPFARLPEVAALIRGAARLDPARASARRHEGR